jgi:3-hydroxyacyl-[acyl-carrier-protein] dehydratase
VRDATQNSEQALNRLPHRAPFLFVTRVLEVNVGADGRGEWDISGSEDFFRGHFPGQPVVPGVLIGEALAQLAGLVGLHVDGRGEGGGRLVQIDVRFDRPVRPPAIIALAAKLVREMGPLKHFDVNATVDGVRVARGMLTLAEVEGGAA